MNISFPAGKCGHIMVVDDYAPLDFVEHVRRFTEAAMDHIGKPGETLGGYTPEKKITTDLRLDARNSWRGEWSVSSLAKNGLPGQKRKFWRKPVTFDIDAMDERLFDIIGGAVRLYVEEYTDLAGVAVGDSGYQLQRYKAGSGHYGVHVDGHPLAEPQRILALVLYLNTVKVGGRTTFPLHDVAADAVQGRIAMFPASWTHPHIAEMPQSEDKLIVNTFIYPNIR
jgi:hypothetical protein